MSKKMSRYLIILFSLFLILVTNICSAQGKEDVFIGHTVPDDPNVLFYIQKNTNPNTIVYALNLDAGGKISADKPMEVFWRRYQEDGRKKKLAWLEKTFAFDFKIKPMPNKANTYVFSLIAMKDRKLYASQDKKGKPRAMMTISGKIAQLERIYLIVDDTKRIQSVLSMELFGRDLKTNKLIYEKIVKD